LFLTLDSKLSLQLLTVVFGNMTVNVSFSNDVYWSMAIWRSFAGVVSIGLSYGLKSDLVISIMPIHLRAGSNVNVIVKLDCALCQLLMHWSLGDSCRKLAAHHQNDSQECDSGLKLFRPRDTIT
jgi:hypothetical protein